MSTGTATAGPSAHRPPTRCVCCVSFLMANLPNSMSSISQHASGTLWTNLSKITGHNPTTIPQTVVFGALLELLSPFWPFLEARSKHRRHDGRSLHYPLTQNDECCLRRATSSSEDISIPDTYFSDA
eukprot:scaffold1989_cov63-Skeletonema_marinoi.AAC.2